MTFQLQAFKAYPIRVDGAQRQHARQVAELKISAANTDTALDISNSAGTFWTAATGDSTYGTLATNALADVTTIKGIAAQFLTEFVPANYNQVTSSPSSTQYTIAISSNLPSITFVSGSAPTSYIVTLEWILKDATDAIVRDYGAAF